MSKGLKGSENGGKLRQNFEVTYVGDTKATKYKVQDDPKIFAERFTEMLPTGFFTFLNEDGRNVVVNISNTKDMTAWVDVKKTRKRKVKEKPFISAGGTGAIVEPNVEQDDFK